MNSDTLSVDFLCSTTLPTDNVEEIYLGLGAMPKWQPCPTCAPLRDKNIMETNEAKL